MQKKGEMKKGAMLITHKLSIWGQLILIFSVVLVTCACKCTGDDMNIKAASLSKMFVFFACMHTHQAIEPEHRLAGLGLQE